MPRVAVKVEAPAGRETQVSGEDREERRQGKLTARETTGKERRGEERRQGKLTGSVASLAARQQMRAGTRSCLGRQLWFK